MNEVMAIIESVHWPDAMTISPDRVISGRPSASTLVLDKDARSEHGLWKVEPGEFTTRLDGYREFIHIVEGRGQLIHEDGPALDLRPGVVIVLPEGWAGRWLVETTLVKSYSIIRTG